MRKLFQCLILGLFALAISCSKDGQHEGVSGANSSGVAQFSTECGTMNDEACEAFRLINQERTSRGVAPLLASVNCNLASQAHAQDMSDNNYFSHDGLNETWGERMDRFNISGAMAENIANSSSASSAVNQWINSAGHRNNLLNSRYLYSGIGHANGYWVQCFSSNP